MKFQIEWNINGTDIPSPFQHGRMNELERILEPNSNQYSNQYSKTEKQDKYKEFLFLLKDFYQAPSLTAGDSSIRPKKIFIKRKIENQKIKSNKRKLIAKKLICQNAKAKTKNAYQNFKPIIIKYLQHVNRSPQYLENVNLQSTENLDFQPTAFQKYKGEVNKNNYSVRLFDELLRAIELKEPLARMFLSNQLKYGSMTNRSSKAKKCLNNFRIRQLKKRFLNHNKN